MTITRNLTGTGLSGLAAQAISGTVADGLTATGTTQANALILSSDLNVFSTVASGTGAIFPLGGENDEYGVVNGGANALKIYPPVGGTINGGAVNAAYSLPAGTSQKFTFQTSSTILPSPGSQPSSGNAAFVTTAGQTYTFPTTSATMARTDAANTFAGAQTFGSSISTSTSGTGSAIKIAPGTTGSKFLYFGSTPGDNASGITFYEASNSTTNWEVGTNITVSGAYQFIPSTTGGGTTYTTSVCDIATTGVTITGTHTVSGGFGCNTKAAQTAYASGGALNAYGAGVNGFDTSGNASALHAMVVAIRAALVANGIMS